MQTTAQNYLSKHGEWKFITLTVGSRNSNFTTQLKSTMGRKWCDLNEKAHTGAGRTGGNILGTNLAQKKSLYIEKQRHH